MQRSCLTTKRIGCLAQADHLAHLNAIWQGETTALAVDRYRQAIREHLSAEWAGDPLDSAQATWLWRTLRRAEAAGLDVRDVARRAIEHRPLTGTRDLAAVLDARIRKDHPVMVPAHWRPWAEQVPDTSDAEQRGYLGRLAVAMDARKQRLGQFAAQAQPVWAIEAAGPVPADPIERGEWERRVSHVGAYRELYGWDHTTEPIGLPRAAVDSGAGEINVSGQLQRIRGQLIHKMRTKADDDQSGDVLPLPDICTAALELRHAQQEAERELAGESWKPARLSPSGIMSNDLVFTTLTGTNRDPRNFNRSFDSRCDKAGVRRIRVHDTRHTCASLLAALDVHPRVAMAILRHAQIAITMEIYTEVPDEVTRAALKRLGDQLGRPRAEAPTKPRVGSPST